MSLPSIQAHFRAIVAAEATRQSDPLVTISLATLAAESDRYRPGYFDAVLAARLDVESPAHVITIDSSTLDTIRRQHAPGCCGQ